jgi:ABC-type multidrug transport system ATPase subunit
MSEWAIEAENLIKKFPKKVNKETVNYGNNPSEVIPSKKRSLWPFTKKADKGYFSAVDGVTLQIQKGEIFGLLGPNGAENQRLSACCVPCWSQLVELPV